MIEAGQLAERVVGHPLPGKLKSGGNLDKYRARAGRDGSRLTAWYWPRRALSGS
jgi:hypothetical protein